MSFPGWALASAISSFTDFAGTAGFITRMKGEVASSVTGAKSLTGSYCSLDCKNGKEREVADAAEKNRVPVRGRCGCECGADLSARAAAVVDDDRLADSLRERLADGTCQEIVAAAGRKRHDHPDRSCRIFVGDEGLNTDADEQRDDDE